jgi:hypothetical protein
MNMNKVIKSGVFLLLGIMVFTLISASCGIGANGSGLLQGQVNIGPIAPVQSDTPVATAPEVYAARKVLVYDKTGEELLYTVSLNDAGYYRIELPAGTYVVDINHAGIDRSSEVPATIEIKAGQTEILNISIDTGIR